MNDHARAIVEKATVRLLGKGGLGVRVHAESRVVPGFILTAAHCIEHYGSGGMTLGDYCLERFRVHDGEELVAQTCAVEPVSDIAVLGTPDNQELSTEAGKFERFCEETGPVPISTNEPELFERFPVCVFTHHGTWIEGTAQLCQERAYDLAVEAPIEAGTSGGPIVEGFVGESGLGRFSRLPPIYAPTPAPCQNPRLSPPIPRSHAPKPGIHE